jgi:hypothetical protein
MSRRDDKLSIRQMPDHGRETVESNRIRIQLNNFPPLRGNARGHSRRATIGFQAIFAHRAEK